MYEKNIVNEAQRPRTVVITPYYTLRGVRETLLENNCNLNSLRNDNKKGKSGIPAKPPMQKETSSK